VRVRAQEMTASVFWKGCGGHDHMYSSVLLDDIEGIKNPSQHNQRYGANTEREKGWEREEDGEGNVTRARADQSNTEQ